MRELARRSGVSHATISMVIAEETRPSYEFCAAIAKPLDMRPEDVFRLAGLLRQTRGDDDEITYRKVLDLMRELTPEERQRVLEYLTWRWEAVENERKASDSRPPRLAPAGGDSG